MDKQQKIVTITRNALNSCQFSSNDPKLVKFTKDLLKVYVDGCIYSKKYQEGYWDGFIKFSDKHNNFDFGLLKDLLPHFEKAKIKFEFVDNYQRDFKLYKLPKFLKPYQKNSIKAFFQDNVGIIKVPTRGGKTFIACELMRQVLKNDGEANILFVVDTTDLFRQTVDEIIKYMRLAGEIYFDERHVGLINADHFEFKKINVAMIQTMDSIFRVRKKKKKIVYHENRKTLQKFLGSVDFLIVDEIQEFSSSKRMDILKKCKNVQYRVGLSATPYRDNDEVNNLKIGGFFGGICYEITGSELQEAGFLANDKALLVNFNHRTVLASNYHEFLQKCIHENIIRNELLVGLIELCNKNRLKTLVLFSSKVHGNLIAEETEHHFISGDTDKWERDVRKAEFLEGKGKVLLASNIYKKGITLPEAQVLIIADGGLESSNVIQKKGRVLGAVAGKSKAVIIDIMDTGAKYFSEHSLNRLETYDKEMGRDKIEIYEENDLESVEESLIEWLSEDG